MILQYNEIVDRYNDLHCGESFKINIDPDFVTKDGIYGKWIAVRIEKGANGWYLIDENGFTKSCKALEGMGIQINE